MPELPEITYKNPAVGSFGNVSTGSNTPKRAPYGNCTNAPRGQWFGLSADNGWSRSRARAASVKIDGSAWGFSVTAGDGFTNTILQDYEAGAGATTTYICGNGDLPNVSKIWNTAH